MRSRPLVIGLALSSVLACSDSGGGGGGGGGGDPVAALAAIGLAPADLADMAGATMVSSLAWITNDGAVPTTRSGNPCPSFVQGPDDDTSGHPDQLDVVFDCTDLEGLVTSGTLSVFEYSDPASEFADDLTSVCADLLGVDTMGVPSWGMSGSINLQMQEPGGTVFGVNGLVAFAEFPDANKLVIEVQLSLPAYPTEAGHSLIVDAQVCATLAADDSTDFPSGTVDTFVYDGPPPAILSLECELLTDGTVAFDAYGADDLIGSGILDLTQGDENEVQFD